MNIIKEPIKANIKPLSTVGKSFTVLNLSHGSTQHTLMPPELFYKPEQQAPEQGTAVVLNLLQQIRNLNYNQSFLINHSSNLQQELIKQLKNHLTYVNLQRTERSEEVNMLQKNIDNRSFFRDSDKLTALIDKLHETKKKVTDNAKATTEVERSPSFIEPFTSYPAYSKSTTPGFERDLSTSLTEWQNYVKELYLSYPVFPERILTVPAFLSRQQRKAWSDHSLPQNREAIKRYQYLENKVRDTAPSVLHNLEKQEFFKQKLWKQWHLLREKEEMQRAMPTQNLAPAKSISNFALTMHQFAEKAEKTDPAVTSSVTWPTVEARPRGDIRTLVEGSQAVTPPTAVSMAYRIENMPGKESSFFYPQMIQSRVQEPPPFFINKLLSTAQSRSKKAEKQLPGFFSTWTNLFQGHASKSFGEPEQGKETSRWPNETSIGEAAPYQALRNIFMGVTREGRMLQTSLKLRQFLQESAQKIPGDPSSLGSLLPKIMPEFTSPQQLRQVLSFPLQQKSESAVRPFTINQFFPGSQATAKSAQKYKDAKEYGLWDPVLPNVSAIQQSNLLQNKFFPEAAASVPVRPSLNVSPLAITSLANTFSGVFSWDAPSKPFLSGDSSPLESSPLAALSFAPTSLIPKGIGHKANIADRLFHWAYPGAYPMEKPPMEGRLAESRLAVGPRSETSTATKQQSEHSTPLPPSPVVQFPVAKGANRLATLLKNATLPNYFKLSKTWPAFPQESQFQNTQAKTEHTFRETQQTHSLLNRHLTVTSKANVLPFTRTPITAENAGKLRELAKKVEKLEKLESSEEGSELITASETSLSETSFSETSSPDMTHRITRNTGEEASKDDSTPDKSEASAIEYATEEVSHVPTRETFNLENQTSSPDTMPHKFWENLDLESIIPLRTLEDKVYARIEKKLLSERRRRGL